MSIACVSGCVLADWRDALEIMAADASPALNGHGRSRLNSSHKIPLAEFISRLEALDLGARQPSVAWRTGQKVNYASRGRVGAAVMGATTLGAALRRLCEFFPLVQDASALTLQVDERWSVLSYRILDPHIWPRGTDAIYSLGIYAGFVRAAAPDAWPHVEATLECEAGAVRGDLAGVMGINILYGGQANALRFPTAVLAARFGQQTEHPAHLLPTLTRDLVRKRRATPLADRARDIIYREMNDGYVSQEHVARELGVSSRTLRRKLASETLSYQAILDECRMQLAALEFRSRKNLSLSEVALKLGYSEHSTFSRAFARWAGMAPQEYRRRIAPVSAGRTQARSRAVA